MRNNLDIASLILQLYNLILLQQDFNNSDLMQELQTQDEKYFKKIIEQNNQMIRLLERSDSYGREDTKNNR